MNEKFVPPMTRKYNIALSVNAKLLNLEGCPCTLRDHKGQKSQQISVLGEY